MDLQLKNKTAFISGSTQGIGFAIAQQLLAEEANVIINGRTEEKTQLAVEQLRKAGYPGTVTGIAADFSRMEEVAGLVEQLQEVDILVNNVGIFELKPFADIEETDWMNIFRVNVMSGVSLSKALLPGMLQRNWGRIIFISSESGVNIPPNMIHYGVTKAAMQALGNGLSKLTKGTAITVNTILGGPTYSDGVANAVVAIASAQGIEVVHMKTAILNNTNPHSLLQRFIEPGEIAGMVAYLCSPQAVVVNGAALRADGGVLQVL